MPTTTEETSVEYRYPHFQRQFLRDDLGFHGAPEPGSPIPDFDLMTVDGRRLSKSDLLGRPFLVVFGSCTCPMTLSGIDALKRLHDAYGRDVEFVTVYVREAFPGDRIGQAQTFDEKMTRAAGFRQMYAIPWTVAVDDLEGGFHRRFAGHPSSAYLVDSNGVIAYRCLWSNSEAALRYGLDQVARGRRGTIGEDDSRLVPMLTGLGMLDETLDSAGDQARRDVRRQAPPFYAMGRLAGFFRPLPPLGRAIAALGVVAAAVAGAAAAAGSLTGRRRRR